MKHILLVLTLFGVVFAETVQELKVIVLSEYYYEGVVVEYDITATNAKAGKEMSFLVPFSTDSAFIINNNNGNQVPEIQPVTPYDNEKKQITFKLNSELTKVFIFFNPFESQTGLKEFTFSVQSDVNLPHYHLIIQEPLAATEFQITGSENEPEILNDDHGIKSYQVHIEDQKSTDFTELTIRYQNPTGKNSVEILATQMKNQPAKSGSDGNHSVKPKRHRLLLWEPIAVLAILSIFLGVYFSKSLTKKSDGMHESEDEKSNFCRHCGQKIIEKSKYCSNCGKEVN